MKEKEFDDYIEISKDLFKEKYPNLSISICPPQNKSVAYADYMIYRGKVPAAVVELKNTLNEKSVNNALYVIQESFKSYGLRYGIIAQDPHNCLIVVRKGKGAFALFPTTFEKALEFLTYKFSEEEQKNLKEVAKRKMQELFKDVNNSLSEYLETLEVADYDISDNGISLNEKKEKEFFMHLLWGEEPRKEKLTKYCTKGALFRILNSKKQSMASIVNMNDKSECDYADKILDNESYSWADYDAEGTTNCFLMSMVAGKRNDELTPWRLYGDNSKGASITYDMANPIIKNDNFYIAPVHYVKDKKNDPLISAMTSILNTQMLGLNFTFNDWNVWKHFFKSSDYEVEKEYRIIFRRDYNKGGKPLLKWVNDESTGIVFPVVEFDLALSTVKTDDSFDKDETFPFKIIEVILGSNMSEIETNKTEIALMAKDKFNVCLNIEESKILSYRSNL